MKYRSPIFVVEDDREIREALKELLELEGFPVQTAANGAEAIRALESQSGPCLVLLDLTMPEMNGWEFLEQAEKGALKFESPVLIFSAVAGYHQLRSPMIKGIFAKPTDLERLIDRVHEQYTELQRTCPQKSVLAA